MDPSMSREIYQKLLEQEVQSAKGGASIIAAVKQTKEIHSLLPESIDFDSCLQHRCDDASATMPFLLLHLGDLPKLLFEERNTRGEVH